MGEVRWLDGEEPALPPGCPHFQTGLLRKERCGDDRRGAFVVATDADRRAIEAAAPHHVAMVRRLFIDPLTPGELVAITSAAEKVLAALDQDRTGDVDDDGSRRHQERHSA